MNTYVLQNGADVDAKAVGGVTALHIAADHGDERMVDCLLAAGANPDVVDDVRSLFFFLFVSTFMNLHVAHCVFPFYIAYFLNPLL